MNTFKNAKTATKLMLAFGLLAALIGLVGYQGVSSANTINNMLDTLYERHMLGAAQIQDAKALIPTIGREIRQALLESEVQGREKSARNLQEEFSALEEAIGAAEKNLVTEEGKAAMAKLRRLEVEYKSMLGSIAQLAIARQDKAALELMLKAKTTGDSMIETCASLAKMKDKLGRQAYEDSDTIFYSTRRILLGVVFASVALAIFLGVFISRQISRPLSHTVKVLESVAGCDLTQALEVETTDEVGQMAKSLNQAVEAMRSAITEVRLSAEGVATAAEELAASSEELSSGTQEQAASQEETSATIEELAIAVKRNAENARQANSLASGARESAENGGAVVGSAVEAMAEINASSKRIAEIITAIDEIAFQTNLLALNAAVEAARAGEQGRGFAVVASEVRNLAQRSATAAKEIKVLIQDSVRKVETGSELVNRSGQTLTDIVASVKRVTDIVAEIAAASQEQATGIEQVTKAVSQMDQVTQNNSAQTEELASTSQTLASHATQMQAMVSRFRVDSGKGAEAAPRAEIRTAPRARPAVRASRSLENLSKRTGRSQSPETADARFEEF